MGNIATLISQVRYLSNGSGFLQFFRLGTATDWSRPERERPRMLKLDARLRACRGSNFGCRIGQQRDRPGSAEEKPDQANLGAKPLSEIAFGHDGPAARWSTVQRKLAAILFADIAGYTRLMDIYEAETHHRLMMIFDEIVDPAIAATGGCVVKNTGDGFLARFESVTTAVECALAIQQSANSREACQPASKRLVFRMGLHVADVIIELRDVYGAGVNIAARLEELAEPGSITISASVREQLGTNLTVRAIDLGEVRLKNVSEPVRAFRLLVLAEAESPDTTGLRDSVIREGLTEDLAAALGHL
jgi:class 3 adenylate cyclase